MDGSVLAAANTEPITGDDLLVPPRAAGSVGIAAAAAAGDVTQPRPHGAGQVPRVPVGTLGIPLVRGILSLLGRIFVLVGLLLVGLRLLVGTGSDRLALRRVIV